MTASPLTTNMFPKFIEPQETLRKYPRTTDVDGKNTTNEDVKSKICDESCVREIKRQLDIHERLYNRHTCGELPRNNPFYLHLDHMAETRKNLLKQLKQM